MGTVTLTHKGRELEELLQGVLRQESLPIGPLRNREAISQFRTLSPEDPQYVEKVALHIETDFYLGVQSIFQANSHEFSQRAKVENLKQAFVRLGIRTVHGIAMNYDPSVDSSKERRKWFDWVDRLLSHSVLIGAACFHCAKTFRGKNPENCYLVGFFHEIGAVYLLKLLMLEMMQGSDEDFVYQASDRNEIIGHLQETTKQYTPLILKKLHFAEFAINALSVGDPQDGKEDYYKRTLATAHILEECLGDHLYPEDPPNVPGAVPPAAQPKADAPDKSLESWNAACLRATDQIKARFPALSVEVAKVEEIASEIKTRMEQAKRLTQFSFVK